MVQSIFKVCNETEEVEMSKWGKINTGCWNVLAMLHVNADLQDTLIWTPSLVVNADLQDTVICTPSLVYLHCDAYICMHMRIE